MINLRFIERNKKRYFLSEDIFNLIEEIAATEDTDVRNRLLSVVESIKSGKVLDKERGSND